LGNPPGKNNSYGDAINWEILLEKVPARKKLYFITADNDFLSKINKDEFNEFLKEEWKEKNGTHIEYYDSISVFLKDKFENVGITENEVEEEKNITKIINSVLTEEVWAKGRVIHNFDPTVWRWDKNGLVIRFENFGDRSSQHGWGINYIKPLSAGGGSKLENLEPLNLKSIVTDG
jgi:hypothetical protein